MASLRADLARRAQLAWTARVAGATWDEAAQVAGYANKSNAQKAVKRYYGALPRITRDDQRNLWRARLEALWRQAFSDAKQGRTPGERTAAITAGVRIASEAARLDGLHEPSRLEVGVSPAHQEIEAFVWALTELDEVPRQGNILDAQVIE